MWNIRLALGDCNYCNNAVNLYSNTSHIEYLYYIKLYDVYRFTADTKTMFWIDFKNLLGRGKTHNLKKHMFYINCILSVGRRIRHANFNDIIRRALVSVAASAILEPNSLARDDSKRSGGMTLVPWRWDAC